MSKVSKIINMINVKAKIIKNAWIKHNFFHCVISASELAKRAIPGQFINVRINDSLTPFLRRPFSIYNAQDGRVEFIYEIVGEGTRLLSSRKKGEYLDVIGLLGNGFEINTRQDAQNILVAGGMGVAPLFFLAKRIVGRKGIPKPLVLLGAKDKGHLLCEDEFKRLGCRIKVATDDGTKGFKGYVSELLKTIILPNNSGQAINYDVQRTKYEERSTTIYACGPRPMLKEIALIAKEADVSVQMSLEEHMACGVGACWGCVVLTRKGFKRVCKDGPVFEAKDLLWQN